MTTKNTRTEPAAAAVMGALLADAACLGLHWVYDTRRIAEVIETRGCTGFVPIKAAHYADVPAYFAHGQRKSGMLSQYGECLALAMDVMNAREGHFDRRAYQTAYAAHFGMGGTYIGYIDRPTRAAVTQIEAEVCDPSGSDDDQLPALTTIPAIVAAMHGQDGMIDAVDAAISVTHVNDKATRYARMFASLLADVISGTPMGAALHTAANDADGEMGNLLTAALTTDETDSVAYGEVTGRACHLHQGVPLAFHILARADNFMDAVETNIRAGGDSCGRAIVIGALMGAAGGVIGLPFPWVVQVDNAKQLFNQARQLVAKQ